LERLLEQTQKVATNQAKAAAATVAELRDTLASARKEVVVAKSATEALRISLREAKERVSQTAGAREKAVERDGRKLDRREKLWQTREETLKVELAEMRTRLHRGDMESLAQDYAMAMAENTRLMTDKEVTECKFETLEEHYGRWMMHCRSPWWALIANFLSAEMKQWGKGNIKYPTPILKLVMLLCMHEAPWSQIPEYLTHVITTFFPGLVGMPVPTAECCQIWRLALLPMTDLVAALMLSRTKRLSIHHDGSSKNTDKIAVAVLDTDDGQAMPNGVFTQRDGTAKHTAELVFRSAFEIPQVALEKARAHFESCDEMRREEAPTRFSERLASQGDASLLSQLE
jgi:hypothetical protein